MANKEETNILDIFNGTRHLYRNCR